MPEDNRSQGKPPSLMDFISKAVEANRLWLHPGFLAISNLLFTVVFLLMLPLSRSWPPLELFILILLFLMVLIVFFSLVVNLAYVPVNERYLGRILLLYLAQIVVFTKIYFLRLLFFDDGTIPFHGMQRQLSPLILGVIRELTPPARQEQRCARHHPSEPCTQPLQRPMGTLSWRRRIIVDKKDRQGVVYRMQ